VHHGAGLRALLEQAGRPAAVASEFVSVLAREWQSLPLDPAERAMMAYAHQLTSRPGETGAPDVAALRAVGLSDRAIHDLCAIVAYYAFVNRIADGLAVTLEKRFHGEA
jgi:uncharacterized peroxidase-related enzyme